VKLGTGAITKDKLGAGSVTASAVAVSAVENINVRDGAVSGAAIEDRAIEREDVIDQSIINPNIKAGAINDTSMLVDFAVSSQHLMNGSITNDKIVNDSFSREKIADFGVRGFNLADGAITEEKIADGVVVWTHFELSIFELYQEAVLRLVTLESMVYRLKERCINRAALASLEATNPQQRQGKIVVQQADDFTVFCENPEGKSLEELAKSLKEKHYNVLGTEHQTSRRLMSLESAGVHSVPIFGIVVVLVLGFVF
jgi:hypothetical protein